MKLSVVLSGVAQIALATNFMRDLEALRSSSGTLIDTTPTNAVIEQTEPTNTNAPAFDKSGIPWDDRIHSSSKAINQDGSWKKKKGVGDDTVAKVTAELKGAGAPAPVVAALPAAPIPAAPAMPVLPTPTLPPLPTIPVSAPVAPPPPPAAPSTELTWPQLVALMTEKTQKGHTEAINGFANQIGCPVFAMVIQRPDAWGWMYQSLQTLP